MIPSPMALFTGRMQSFQSESSVLAPGAAAHYTMVFDRPMEGIGPDSLWAIGPGTISDIQSLDGGLTWTFTLTPKPGHEGKLGVYLIEQTYWQKDNGALGFGYGGQPIVVTKPVEPPKLEITIDAVAGDDVLNKAESQAPVKVTGQVTGGAQVGDEVKVVIGAATVVAHIADAQGHWEATFDGAAVKAGSQVVATVYARDAAGNVNTAGGVSATHAYAVDTQVGTGQLGLVNFTDSANPYRPGTACDKVSNDRQFSLQVNGMESGATVLRYEVKTGAGWVQTPQEQVALKDGAYEFRAVVRDAAGNEDVTRAVAVTVDTKAPAAPVEAALSADNLHVSGVVEAYATAIVRDGVTNELLGTAQAGSDGHFDVALAAAAGKVSVSAMDLAGNASASLGVNHYQLYTVASDMDAASGPAGYKAYTTGAGNDWIEIGAGAQQCWTIGTWGNIWNNNPGWDGWSVIATGAGDDRIDVGVGRSALGNMYANTGVDMGSGNDVLNLKGSMVNNAFVNMGTGDDKLAIGGFIGTGNSIDLGAGNDTMSVAGSILHGSKVMLGDGNDVLSLGGRCLDGMVYGGAGDDRLVVNYSLGSLGTEVSMAHVRGVETVQLTGKNQLDVNYSDLVCDSTRSGPLFVQGGQSASVDFGSNGSCLSGKLIDGGYCSSAGWWDWCGTWVQGSWAKTGTATVEGVIYNVYHHSFAGCCTANDVYVQQGVAVI